MGTRRRVRHRSVINPRIGVLGGSFSRPTPSTDIIGDAMKGKYPVVPKIPLAFVHVDDVATAIV